MIPIPSLCVPTAEQAQDMYTAQGRQLTEFGLFGSDPLRNSSDLIERRNRLFAFSNPEFSVIYSNIVSGDGNIFKNAIHSFISITASLESEV